MPLSATIFSRKGTFSWETGARAGLSLTQPITTAA